MNGNRLRKIGGSARERFRSGARNTSSFLREKTFTEIGLVSIFLASFVTSGIFLDMKISRDLDPDIGKEWWTLSFEARNPSSLEFAIENHSENTDFSYKVTRDKIVQGGGTVSVERGGRKTVIPSGNGDTEGRTIITVESGDGSKKAIYRERN